MSVVENSYYQHEDWGLVRVHDAMENSVKVQTEQKKTIPNVGKVSLVKVQEKNDFLQKTEPADVGISTPETNVEYEDEIKTE